MAHHGLVFADPIVSADRPKPYAEQHGVHH